MLWTGCVWYEVGLERSPQITVDPGIADLEPNHQRPLGAVGPSTVATHRPAVNFAYAVPNAMSNACLRERIATLCEKRTDHTATVRVSRLAAAGVVMRPDLLVQLVDVFMQRRGGGRARRPATSDEGFAA